MKGTLLAFTKKPLLLCLGGTQYLLIVFEGPYILHTLLDDDKPLL